MSEAFGRGITVTEMTAMDEPVDVHTHSAAAFVGRALRGPLNTPVLLRSFADFSKRFGGVWTESGLGPAVEQFFDHGGQRLYVVRVANNARGAMLCLPAEHGVLVMTAVDPGSTERIRISVDYDRIPAEDTEHFNLTIQRVASASSLIIEQEIYDRLSCNEASKRYIAEVLGDSSLVRVKLPAPPGRPMATIGPHLQPGAEYVLPVQPGTDGDGLSDYDLIGSASERTGLFSLDAVESFDLLYLPADGSSDLGPAAVMAAELYSRRRGAMLIVDPPVSWTSAEQAIAGIRESGYASPNMLSYFPRLVDRQNTASGPRSAAGAIAGLLCKLDDRVGPWCTLEQAGYGFNPVLQPAVALDNDDAAELLRDGLNAISNPTGGKATLRGSVTLARRSYSESKLSSLTLRRLCLHISNSIGRATRWAVFQAGGQKVANTVRAQVHAFMAGLADEGAFEAGTFDVRCESGLHVDPRDPLRGVSIITTFRPAGSPEYVWLTVHQTVQGCRVSSTAFAPAHEHCA